MKRKSLWRKTHVTAYQIILAHQKGNKQAHALTPKHIPESVCLLTRAEKLSMCMLFTHCAAQATMYVVIGQVSFDI